MFYRVPTLCFPGYSSIGEYRLTLLWADGEHCNEHETEVFSPTNLFQI